MNYQYNYTVLEILIMKHIVEYMIIELSFGHVKIIAKNVMIMEIV